MSNPFQLAEVLGHYVERAGYTTGQLAKLSGIPKPTIVNWLEGRVRRPRAATDLLRLAAALHLNEQEASHLLQAASHPTIPELYDSARQTENSEQLSLLVKWTKPTAVSAARPSPFQAMADLPYFVGREAELRELQGALLAAGQMQLVSVQGMGGVGKTTLVAHLAYRVRDHFPDGVLWARVDASDVMSILGTFASGYDLDVSQYGDVHSRSRIVREMLANKRALIVLDNVQNSEQVTPLLPPSGSCAVIITTRRHNLSVTRGAHRLTLGPFDAEKAESLALFTNILGPERVQAERPLLTELAELLGHLPLAVDIAASRLAYEPGWSTADFVARVRREQRRLVELAYEDQSMRLSFNTSYQALSPDLQRFFSALGIFAGDDFSDEAAAAVSALPLEDAQDYLRDLYGLSLVQQGRMRPAQRPRYRLHTLLRAYARAKLETDAVPRRFVNYFVSYTVAHAQDYATLGLEMQNVMEALALAAELEMKEALVLGANAVYPFLEGRGLYELASEQLAAAREAVATHDDLSAALTTCYHLGRLAQRQGEYIEAETLYDEALDLARRLDDSETLSRILRALGVLAARRGDYVLADEYYKEGLDVARRLGHGGAVSDFLRGLGVQAYMEGNFARAEAFYEEGLALMELSDEELEGPRGRGALLWGLGMLARDEEKFDQAEAYYLEALDLIRQIGHLEREIVLLRSLSGSAWDQGQYEEAVHFNESALALARQIGHRWHLARALSERGAIQLAREQIEPAQKAFRELFELARILQSQELVAMALFGLARVSAVQGDVETAEQYGRESLDTFTAIGHHMVSNVKQWLARLLRESDTHE